MGAQGKLRASRFETVETTGIPSGVRSSLAPSNAICDPGTAGIVNAQLPRAGETRIPLIGANSCNSRHYSPEDNLTLGEAAAWFKRSETEVFDDACAGLLHYFNGRAGGPLTRRSIRFKFGDLVARRDAIRILPTSGAGPIAA